MKKIGAILLAVFFMAVFAMPVVSFADENPSAASKSQVDDLTKKVETLERQVQVLSSAPKPTTYAAPAAGGTGALAGITVSGFVDTQYNNNFSSHTTNPYSAAAGPGNPLRSFDNNQNTFTMNNAEIDIEKLANPEGGAGFRIDLSAGEDMRAINTATAGVTGNDANFGFQQAYVQLVAPIHALDGNEILGNTIDIKAGRFVTLAGAEVIEGRDNWNISRSFLFGLGVPLTHTGVRATYKLFKDKLTTFWGINNGWDLNVDNNTWKTWETGLAYNLTDKLSYSNAIYFGPEMAQQESHHRFLFSNVLSYQATDKLALKAEVTLGRQNRIPTGFVAGNTSSGNFDNAQWWGGALYARYAMTDKWGMALRLEYFRDKDRFRTASAAAASASSTLWGATLTSDYKIYENLLGRVEYRFDKSNEFNPFNQDSSQSTVGAQLIYSFA